ncbi:MAG: hypothetical protein M0Z42_11695 [Actinomycetota bacterium]|nr:hypothetical protein [Actinomycetota bacterium]
MLDEAGTGVIEAYEQLRALALGGGSPGAALGTGLLVGRGMAAWAAAWRALPPSRPAPGPAPGPVSGPLAPGAEVVSVLASMALACMGG